MDNAVSEFWKNLRGGGVGLFYYAGHGMQVEGNNYLIPVDAQIETETDVKYASLDAGKVLGKMKEAGNDLNIMILDACRNNPFARAYRSSPSGLAAMDAPRGSLIVFATDKNSVAADGDRRNGVFTESLLRHMTKPGLTIQDVIMNTRIDVSNATGGKQVPAEYSLLMGKFYFADSGGTTIVTPPPVPPPPSPEPKTASLTVTCDTPGAAVEVNGQEYGKAPVTVPIEKAATYTVTVSAAGYKPYTKKEKIALGDKVTVAAYLEKERPAAVPVPAPAQVADSKRFTNSIGQEFVWIEQGTFMMGSPENEPGRSSDEKQHQVTLTKGFYLQTTEVTQGQWKAVMGNNPSYFKNCGDNCPVENVSWNDAQEFIKNLNQKEGKKIYRLPTEAEWEYAARAGTSTPFHTGRCLSTDQANYNGNYPLEGCPKGKYREKTVPAASFAPSAWGLYDMSGNVWEWCQDWYGHYPAGSVTNPEGSSTGSSRILRGGSWLLNAVCCRSADRFSFAPGSWYGSLGFRLVLSPGQQ